MTPEGQDSKVKRAEPDSEPICLPVLRSDVVAIGEAEGPGVPSEANRAQGAFLKSISPASGQCRGAGFGQGKEVNANESRNYCGRRGA